MSGYRKENYMAITQEELEQAEQLLSQMTDKADALKRIVQQASDGIVEGITLTADQKQQLKDKYLNEKSELQNLYSQLP